MDRSKLASRFANLSPLKRALLEERLKEKGLDSLVKQTIPRRATPESAPLSFAQQRLWFLDQYEPNSSVYNVFSALRLKGRLNIGALEQSLNEIVRRHETLRTRFSMVRLEPVQVISPAVNHSLLVVDLRDRSENEREEEVRRLAHEEVRRPFDLSQGPLFRTSILRLGEDDQVLLLTMHHIVSDGWSTGVLYRELSVLYVAFSNGKPSPLEEMPVQYADFAQWQRNWLQGEILETQLSYWKKQLEGAPAVLNLPTDRPRPAVQSYRGSRQSITLSKDLSEKLKGLSRKEGVTLFMTLLAAFQTLLYRYTGQEDVVVGSPIAGRNWQEMEGLIGFFVNTLVLRNDLSENPTFRELLARVRKTALEAYEHQDLPFEKLVEELQPERNLSHAPFFQVMFVLQNAPSTALRFEGLSVTPIRVGGETAKFDLTFSVHEAAEGLRASLQYNIDLFDEATITRMLRHFETLLEGIVADPEQRLSELRILTEAEKRQLLIEWNDTKSEYPKDKGIHELFEEQVERAPDAVAVVFEDQQLTYREVNQHANQLAHYLIKQGVGPEVLVGICVERSVEMVVGLLGILKAGGAYVPLDPSYPKERLEFMLEDSQASLVLTQERLVKDLPHQRARVICLDRDRKEIAKEKKENPHSKATAGNLAYVIYTSGSTGAPKGALITHHNVTGLFEATKAWFHFDQNDIWTLSHSYAFDFSVWEIWGALLHGGKLVVVPFWISRSPDKFYDLLIKEKVTILNQTPSSFRQLIEVEQGSDAPSNLALRFVIFGGEDLNFQSLQPWFDRHGDQCPQLINMYGITETTVHVTYRPVKIADLSTDAASLIGVPIPDLKLYILDQNRCLLPIGVPGELYVGGAGIGRGYLHQPELTAERFIANPISNGRGERFYRSGDLVKRLATGDIEYLGRIDHQVKIRGYRIELGEIESVLSQQPAVRETVVMAREDSLGNRRLVAYVVAAQDSAPSTNELRSFLQQKLPDYMVPSAFVFLDSLPLTPNGKVDRKALPVPEQSRPELDQTFSAPRTGVEEMLAGIWAEVLKLEKAGIHDNFFNLGGHSLLATQVISRVNNSYQIDIPLRRLFETPTIAGLASAIDASLGIEKDPQGIPPIVPIPRSTEIPLSFAQQRLWFLDRLVPGSALYNVPSAFRLIGELNVQALEQSLSEIVRRHEVLRTVFSTVNDAPVQTVVPPSPFSLICTDISDRPAGERDPVLTEWVSEEAERPFDLSHGPLIRAKLLRLDFQEYVLLLNLHHIVSDGWSMGVLFRELSFLYEAYCSGKPSPLPELPIQYADYAVWQKQWLRGEELEKQLSYWRKQLDGLSALQLPTDRVRPNVQTFRGWSQVLNLSEQLSESIKALSQRESVTPFMTLLATFQVLLSRYTGQSDIVVGSPIAGRTRQETEGLIGFFVNTLVLRTDLSNNPTFKELLRQVRETTLEAYTHQDLPFEKLVEELHPDRNLSNSPLFQVMFVFQNTADQPLELERLTVNPIRTTSHVAKFDLSLTMSEKDGKLRGSVNYNTDLFDASTIERLICHFQTLLEGVVANPEARVSDLPILTEAESHQLLVEWNDTKTDYPKDKCIHELFETQVEKTPDAIALVFEDQQLTYRELNNRANQLAQYLQKLGVAPDVLVGVCVERSLEMVVGLLGILKAGGSYLPLDPSYPKERLGFMLKDSGVPVLLTLQEHSQRLPEYGGQIVCLDQERQKIGGESGANLSNKADEINLAYVIYTSGSTGNPKGVMIPHRAIFNHMMWMLEVFPLNQHDRVAQKTPFSFDASVWEFWAPLVSGAQLVLARPEGYRDAEYLVKFLQKEQITILQVGPTLLQVLLEENMAQCTSLRRVFSGGEPLSAELYARFHRQLAVPLINLYGPTEAAIDVTSYACSEDEPPGWLPIGRPISNTQIYVLDQYIAPVPIGVVGEIYIGGGGLARGYLNQPELTAAKFIYHSFSGEPARRLYKTGDLGVQFFFNETKSKDEVSRFWF